MKLRYITGYYNSKKSDIKTVIPCRIMYQNTLMLNYYCKNECKNVVYAKLLLLIHEKKKIK